MNNNQIIQAIKDWLISDRDYTDARILFDNTDEYINSLSYCDVSDFVANRTYSKGTKGLYAYGYYTKSVFQTKCVVNNKRGRLIDYKPWYRAGAFYNFEYGFDAEGKLIETKQYTTALPRDFRVAMGTKEYRVLLYTVIEYFEQDEIALSWEYSCPYPSLVLVTTTINTETEEVTVVNECLPKNKSFLCSKIFVYIYNRQTSRLDRYTLLKSQNPYGRHKEMYKDGIIKICDVCYLDTELHE